METLPPFVRALIEILDAIGLPAVLLYVVSEIGKSARSRREHEAQVRFAALHERRVRVVEAIYRKLTEIEGRLERVVNAWELPRDPDPVMKIMSDANAVRDFITQRKIWLPPATCIVLDEHWATLKEAAYSYVDSLNDRSSRMPDGPGRAAQIERVERKYLDAMRLFGEALPAVRSRLELDIREMLGVLDPEQRPRSSLRERIWSRLQRPPIE